MRGENRRGFESDELKVMVLSHCILNRATRWWQGGNSIEKNQGPVSQVLMLLSDRKIGAIQLPCPEFTFCGNPRPPRTKDEYQDLPGFRSHCRRLAKSSAQRVRTFVDEAREPPTRIIAVVGVERSPTCGVNWTPRTVEGETIYVREKGLFLGLLQDELEKLGLKTPIVGIDLEEPRALGQILDELERLKA